MNTVSWTLKAAKQLHKLDRQHQRAIRDGVSGLETMPDCHNVKALTHHQYGYRLRVGGFRVLFDWDSGIRIIEIQEVRKRDERTY